jgi:energy-coupling factor transporter ATP-binding protein EcfA2
MHVQRWFREELGTARKLTAITATVATTASALLDGAAPYVLTVIIGLVAQKMTDGLILSLVIYGACLGLGCWLNPRRQELRRLMHDVGETRMLTKIERMIFRSPRLSEKTHRTSIMALIKQFFSSWDKWVVVLFDQLISFAVGVGGLTIVLLVVKPILALPVVMMLVVTYVYARKVGKVIGDSWSKYVKVASEEYSLLSDEAANSSVKWVLEVLASERAEVSPLRSAAMRSYIEGMKRYQRAMICIANGFRFSSVATGALSFVFFDVPPHIALLPIVYGISLSDKMSNIFAINDMITTSLVEAEPLIEKLEDIEPQGPKLPADTPAVVEIGIGEKVVVHRPIRDDKTGEIKRIVDVPIRRIRLVPTRPDPEGDCQQPGNIFWFKGSKGSGKSSVAGALGGLYAYDGTLQIGGLEVRMHDVRDFVFNGPQSFDSMTRPVSMLFGGDDADPLMVKQALTWVGFTDVEFDRPLEAHSGGETECLFRAGLLYRALRMANETPEASGIITIDEPTNHLDLESIVLMLDGIRELALRLPNQLIWVNSHCPDMARIVLPENTVDLSVKV